MERREEGSGAERRGEERRVVRSQKGNISPLPSLGVERDFLVDSARPLATRRDALHEVRMHGKKTLRHSSFTDLGGVKVIGGGFGCRGWIL